MVSGVPLGPRAPNLSQTVRASAGIVWSSGHGTDPPECLFRRRPCLFSQDCLQNSFTIDLHRFIWIFVFSSFILIKKLISSQARHELYKYFSGQGQKLEILEHLIHSTKLAAMLHKISCK